MKRMRKIVSALLMTAMLVSTSAAVMAMSQEDNTLAGGGNLTLTTGDTVITLDGAPSASDKVDVKITNIKGSPTVNLYQIASAKYGNNDMEFIEYSWNSSVSIADKNSPTADEIAVIANNIMNNSLVIAAEDTKTSVGDTYIYKASAGAYIAIISGADDGTVYNPVLLTASYADGKMIGGTVDSTVKYLFGTTAVAKQSSPGIDKTVEGTTADGDKNTASVGDVLTYTIKPTMPSYPASAANKTFFISDTMDAGLTFHFDSLTVKIDGTAVAESGDAVNGYTYTYNGKEIAKATAIKAGETETITGFDLCFNYSNLIVDSSETDEYVYTPEVTYNAVVNENAVAGAPGNTNIVTLYYANEPNTGSAWDDATDKNPDNATDGVTSKTDTETVYTYQLAFQKTGEDTDNDDTVDPLADAVFGIYSDSNCTTLIDVVKTNENGYAVSTNVAAGKYYIKEIAAPTGYSLNEKTYSVEVKWETAIMTASSTDRTWTTTAPETDPKQIGWAIGNVFYAMDEFSADTANAAGATAAYLDTETTTTVTIVEKNSNASGTTLLSEIIPNTKLSALPSTGGIGTYLFTIIGVAVMAAMAMMFLRGRKEEEK